MGRIRRGVVRQTPAGTWEVMVSGTDPITGARVRRSRTVRTEREAENLRTRLLRELDLSGAGAKDSLAFLLDAWLSNIERDLSPTSVDLARGHIAKHINPAIGHISLSKLRAREIDGFYRHLLDKGLSASTVRRVNTTLRAALGQAVKWDWIDVNPTRNARLPQDKPVKLHTPTAKEIQRLLEAATGDLKVFLRLALVTGARRGELCALRWSDLVGTTLTISRSIARTSQGLVEKGMKSRTSQPRLIDLDPVTAKLLATERKRQTKIARGLDPDAHIFSPHPEHAVPYDPSTLTTRFVRLAKDVGVKCRLHDLRHASATLLIDAGIPLPVVSKRLGHAKVTTTLDIYASAVETRDKEAAKVLGRVLKG